jgi:formylglycine-generating enzyme required for sulfatase activity
MIKRVSSLKRLLVSIFLLLLLSVLLPADMSYATTMEEREAAELERLAKQDAEKVAKQQAADKAEREQQARIKEAAEKKAAEEQAKKVDKAAKQAKKAAEQKRAAEEAKRLAAQAAETEKQQTEQKAADVEKSTVPKTTTIEPEMVAIKGGCFMMGSNPDTAGDEKHHNVCVEDFKIGKYEVTQAQWQAVMGKNPSNFKGDDLPVEQVSYNDVQDFINKLNAQTGQRYRLPTEAEWEFAARAKTSTPFYTGDCINTEQANYNGSYDYNDCGAKTGVYKAKTVAVGSYPANPWGLYDMAGNVWEWTDSVYDANYGGAELQSSSKNDAKTRRVIRGGSWNTDPPNSRSAFRFNLTPDNRNYFLGFRLSRM